MSFVSFPRAAIAIRRLGFHYGPAFGTNQYPVVGGSVHDAVQRSAHHLTKRASFDAGSDSLWHFMIVTVCGDADQAMGAGDTKRDGRSLVSLCGSDLGYHVCFRLMASSWVRGAVIGLACFGRSIDQPQCWG